MPMHLNSSLALLAAVASAVMPAQAQNCSAKSSAQAVAVVELYTSEGCSSCPPADRWLSQLKNDPSVIALAFHVDYWDRLGWTDRFASPTFTQRQAQQQTVNGSRFSYTPQVVIDGVDRKDWPQVSADSKGAIKPKAARVQLTLQRDGEQFEATVQALAAPVKLAAYWAVTEDKHVTAVKGGENSGVTLQHNDVVRELLPVSAWQAQAGQTTTLRFSPSTHADAAHPRQVKLVVLDAATGRPLQALKLGC